MTAPKISHFDKLIERARRIYEISPDEHNRLHMMIYDIIFFRFLPDGVFVKPKFIKENFEEGSPTKKPLANYLSELVKLFTSLPIKNDRLEPTINHESMIKLYIFEFLKSITAEPNMKEYVDKERAKNIKKNNNNNNKNNKNNNNKNNNNNNNNKNTKKRTVTKSVKN